ncbi:EAL domain-containing protein [Poseidonibacter lekithochrous]|uniref:sensor domain-containing protein n=1 Tax=Poseidonibacter TaxID=2321187 RepID=UPI001C08F5D7|nr:MULTISPECIES: bifunctional diguanylate cyclase/phosphodiesterase [Poseidonibacter]MBU3013566.1 EAL domain-containing protein [Poseidonibacter lekithochrous]MDO6826863.1 EAL domain-containing protein [Poseidonibacter sp. 1_MG-2023]
MKFTKKKFFIYIISIIFILLFTLFIYLIKIQDNIKDYTIYKNQFTNLIHIEKEFNYLFSEKNKAINIEKIEKQLLSFKEILTLLNNNNLKKDFGNKLLSKLNLINSEYEKRLKLIKDYKSSIVSSSTEQLNLKNNLLEQSQEISLEDSTISASILLDKKHNDYLQELVVISFLFFIAAISIIIIFIRISFKNIKINNELLAFKYAVEHSDNSIVLTDENKNIVYLNENVETNSGYLKNELLGENPRILASGLTVDTTYVQMNKRLEQGLKWDGEFINKRKDGTLYYEKVSIVPIFINGKIQNYLAIKLDITKYIKQRDQLKESLILFENTEEGILITDEKQKIISVNKAFEKISGYKKKELIGEKPSLFKSNKHDIIFYKRMWASIEENGHWKGKVYDKIKDGSIIPTWLNITAVKDKNGKIIKYISIHTDLQEIIDTQEKADYLAYHDSLTNLPNRIKLEDHLSHVISVANRDNLSMSILFIDLDRFKIINDTLGHQIGDRLLQNVAKNIKSVLRDTDMVARMGGDEFIVVLETARNKKEAAYVCEKILNILKEPIKIKEHILNTSGSIGVAMFPDNGTNMTTLIKNADTAMYHAKSLGKNNYQYYNEELSINIHNQLKIEQALKHSVSNNELYLNYQPQYELKTKKIISLEALVRWNSKIIGFVPPNEFIPAAEDSGMIVEIGDFVFEQASIDFKKFKKIHNELQYIAINISTIQFKDKNFINKIKEIIKRVDIKPSQIELEITERYIMEFNESNITILEDLRALGFRMSIDDFGTGYSSMNYLTKLPIDIIKVDKSFVNGIPNDNNNMQISKAIIALSKSLGYKTVAEGIETKEQEETLISLDCNIGQGYLFSKPLNYEDAVEFLKERV